MIIVSQDKYNILNFDTTVNIGIEEITTLSDIVQISAQTNGNIIILGKYKTEERAKEVLQEIIEFYEWCEYKKVIQNINIMAGVNYKDFVFEMPEE